MEVWRSGGRVLAGLWWFARLPGGKEGFSALPENASASASQPRLPTASARDVAGAVCDDVAQREIDQRQLALLQATTAPPNHWTTDNRRRDKGLSPSRIEFFLNLCNVSLLQPQKKQTTGQTCSMSSSARMEIERVAVAT